MASYIATGCITVFVAAIRASFDWRDRYAAVLDNRSVAKPDPNEKGLRKPLKKMLYVSRVEVVNLPRKHNLSVW